MIEVVKIKMIDYEINDESLIKFDERRTLPYSGLGMLAVMNTSVADTA